MVKEKGCWLAVGQQPVELMGAKLSVQGSLDLPPHQIVYQVRGQGMCLENRASVCGCRGIGWGVSMMQWGNRMSDGAGRVCIRHVLERDCWKYIDRVEMDRRVCAVRACVIVA